MVFVSSDCNCFCSVIFQFSGENSGRMKSAYGEFCSNHIEAVELYKVRRTNSIQTKWPQTRERFGLYLVRWDGWVRFVIGVRKDDQKA